MPLAYVLKIVFPYVKTYPTTTMFFPRYKIFLPATTTCECPYTFPVRGSRTIIGLVYNDVGRATGIIYLGLLQVITILSNITIAINILQDVNVKNFDCRYFLVVIDQRLV